MKGTMVELRSESRDDPESREGEPVDGDLNDLLQELRILLQGAQVLAAFLIVVPFGQGFAKIDRTEQWVYLATFISSVGSMVFFVAPAAQHRLERPLKDRDRFKQTATRITVVGLVLLSAALVLATNLVVTEVVGRTIGIGVAASVAGVIGMLWWMFPLAHRTQGHTLADAGHIGWRG